MGRKFVRLLLTTAFFGVGCGPTPVFAQNLAENDEAHRGATEYSSPEHSVAVEQNYDPRPAIWRITDEDTTIHLFGTFHILPEGFRWRTPAFDAIAAEADELVLETTEEAVDSEEATSIAYELGLLIANRAPTSAGLTPANINKWQSLASQSGIDYAEFDSLPIFLSMVMLAVTHLESTGSSELYGVEPSLEYEFRRTDRPILTIEDSMAVLINVLKLDEKPMIAELDQQLTEWDGKDLTHLIYGPAAVYGGGTSSFDASQAEHAWAKGEELGDLNWGDSEVDLALRQILLTERNIAWSAWLDHRLGQPGNVLVAVGAGHFAGDDSVIALLEQRGIKVERIQ